MAQPPYMPQRPFSPPQPVNSPSTQNQQFAFPPHKRQRMSPNPPSQPTSPYVTSPYAMSPGASGQASASPSPHFSTVQLPQTAYTTPYANGLNTAQPSPSLNLPQTPGSLPPHAQPSTLGFQGQVQQHHQGNTHAAHFNNFNLQMPQHHPGGIMGPPSRPVDRNKLDSVDPMDVLGGTGIDLAEEEQYTFQQYSSSFNPQVSRSHPGNISAGHSFSQFPPGHEDSFYGSGPANQPGESPNTKSQAEFEKKAADKAWHDAARDLAVSRQRELNNPFLNVANVHKRMEKIAHDNGLGLNTDMNGKMGTMKLPEHFPDPIVKVQTAVGPEGAITATNGFFIPGDSLLVDQLALMSISTKHRLRGLLEIALKLAIGRQTGSHAQIRDEWADVAVNGVRPSVATIVDEGGPRSGWESAISPLSTSLKRPLSATGRLPTPVSESAKTQTKSFGSDVASTLRKAATKEQEAEEARLRKRKARESGDGSRVGSINPGTPGSIAPDILDKPPTKKEMKRKAEAKTSEAASHAAANVTTGQFLGGRNVFGKKKQYSWMTAGSNSGTSTPGKIMAQGLGASSSSPIVSPGPEKLTIDGVRRLGTWREDGVKGRNIQLRDWIMVLEDDGREKKALQKAYAVDDDHGR
ncbi:hypothetical protein DSL72_007878 [Monilinia vaccinii-corymbosi]|uniref:Transcription initiation factor TFIID subunit 4 n=1 Tax=Monilinia vaccinii-corymbosi TaxID=61207 RepID=A0A8A3PJA3_9HELO|nr:hypothetical protein DSL72_007878 [Monilinia vaccinii-corymbosi]